MTETTLIHNRGRNADVLVSGGTLFAKVTAIHNGAAVVEMFTADELRELADAMDAAEQAR